MNLSALFHSWMDNVVKFVRIIQNRQVGWMTMDRQTKTYIRELQPLSKKIRMLILFSPVFEMIDVKHAFRFFLAEKAIMAGRRTRDPRSKQQIKGFVDFYGIDMAEFDPSDINQYQAHMHRLSHHRVAVHVADAHVVTFPTVSEAKSLWIKGHDFTIGQLVQDDDLAKPWTNGAIASYRLSPQDYHRYHSPVDGVVRWCKPMDGSYYAVDPIALRSKVNVLNANARTAICIESKEFGRVLLVAIGAKEVGSVKINNDVMQPGHVLSRGDEIGRFEFGGSSIIVGFEAGRIQFDRDLLDVSKRLVEISVMVKDSLGQAS